MSSAAAKRVRLSASDDRVVGVIRSFPGLRKVDGLVCRVGDVWALLHVLDDLRLDGWECVRLQDVKNVVHGAHERFAEKILRREHALEELEHPDISLGDISSLLKSLRSRPMVALECEADGDFMLGRVLRIDTRSVDIHTVDPGGVWFRHATRVQLADITRVQFGNHYTAMFERYALSRRPPTGSVARERT